MIGSIGLFNSSIYDKNEFENLTDKELIEKIREDDKKAEKYLYARYANVVKKIVSSFFILGGEKDDLFQEAMIGLISAVNNYNFDYDTSFRTFAEVCIRRQIISAIRKSKSYEIINNSISINEYSYEKEYIFEQFVNSESLNPENVFINEEEKNTYYEIATEILSDFEKEVLKEYGKNKTYAEISITLKKDIKSIDNALQRVKKKIKKHKEKLYK